MRILVTSEDPDLQYLQKQNNLHIKKSNTFWKLEPGTPQMNTYVIDQSDATISNLIEVITGLKS